MMSDSQHHGGEVELVEKQSWRQEQQQYDENGKSGTADQDRGQGENEDEDGDEQRLLIGSRSGSGSGSGPNPNPNPSPPDRGPEAAHQKHPPKIFSRALFLYPIFGVACGVLGFLLGFTTQVATSGSVDQCSASPAETYKADRVIILSLDGFRYDYLDKYAKESSFLNQIRDNATAADFLLSVFPSKTFPNHYSIMTGLYPSSHGIIANSFSVPGLGQFTKSGSLTRDFWLGEPLWVTMAKSGRKSAQIFWPGIGVEWNGTWDCDDLYPLCQPFNSSVPTLSRADLLLDVLNDTNNHAIEFLSLYFNEVDHVGHGNGPDSPQIAKAIANVDNATEHLVQGLKALGLWDSTDLIIVSDHGMASNSCPAHILYWDQVFPTALATYSDLLQANELNSPLIGIRPEAGKESEVYNAMKKDLEEAEEQRIQLFLKEDLDVSPYFYSHLDRIPPIVGFVDEGYVLLAPDATSTTCGTHGYDPTLGSMHALFLAAGPDFVRGKRVEAFQNVHISTIIGEILDLELPPNNGSEKVAESILGKRSK